ncbi:MAG: cytochrome P450 [Acidimicrobiales bacterium]
MSDQGSERPLEWINPILPSFWVRPLPEIEGDMARLRAEEPLAWRPPPELPEDSIIKMGPYWAVTRYADILAVSKQPELFSSAQGITMLEAPPSFNEFFGSMIAMDDPRHARLRKLVSSGFTPRMLRRVEDSVARIAAEIVDAVAERGEIDFVVDVAAALPLRVICEMMGIPASQFQFVFERTNVILGAGDPEYVDGIENILGAVLQAGADLAKLMEELANSKLAATAAGEDLTSLLVRAEVDGERLTHAELASFFILLVVAGNETTRNAISWGLHFLTENPDQRRIWQNDFERLAPAAVDEIVRMASPVTYMRRTATRDCELRGQRIAEGDRLALLYWSANRDEDVFVDGLRFDVNRHPNEHVGFGGPGPHFCLGAHLARREITVMFRELFRRLPDIDAAGPPDPLLSAFIHGVKHLPARFTPS